MSLINQVESKTTDLKHDQKLIVQLQREHTDNRNLEGLLEDAKDENRKLYVENTQLRSEFTNDYLVEHGLKDRPVPDYLTIEDDIRSLGLDEESAETYRLASARGMTVLDHLIDIGKIIIDNDDPPVIKETDDPTPDTSADIASTPIEAKKGDTPMIARRKELGLTVEELAAAVDEKVATIKNIEAGKRKSEWPLGLAPRLSTALNVKSKELNKLNEATLEQFRQIASDRNYPKILEIALQYNPKTMESHRPSDLNALGENRYAILDFFYGIKKSKNTKEKMKEFADQLKLSHADFKRICEECQKSINVRGVKEEATEGLGEPQAA